MLQSRKTGLGAYRLPLPAEASWEDRMQRNSEMLSRVLNLRTTVAFIGAGCSIPLGYPSWGKMTLTLVEAILSAFSDHPNSKNFDQELRRLKRLKKKLGSQSSISVDLMFYIGLCKQLADRETWEDNPFLVYFRNEFKRGQYPNNPTINPYHALMDLPITRFITTNYDCEIEEALSEKRSINFEDFGVNKSPASNRFWQSFTQEPQYCKQLALFGLSRVYEKKGLVFHCHGRYDRTDSIVATEPDYQRWYFGNSDELGSEFRQTIRLLLNSNPILFLGYSLGDEDLLRPIRSLGATHPNRKEGRPLFALAESQGDDQDYCEHLFERYGLHVITYNSPISGTPEERGAALSLKLREIKHNWITWQQEWHEKPVFKKVTVPNKPKQPYHHFGIDFGSHLTLGEQYVRKNVDDLIRRLESRTRIIAIVGKGGTGKSWHAMRLLDSLSVKSSFEGFFFLSYYYVDDLLTGVERALQYFEVEAGDRDSRMKRLVKCLTKGRFVIVFDGFERLMRETKVPDVGKPYLKQVVLFLKDLLNSDIKSKVILTTRLWPDIFNDSELSESPLTEKFTLKPITADEIGRERQGNRTKIHIV